MAEWWPRRPIKERKTKIDETQGGAEARMAALLGVQVRSLCDGWGSILAFPVECSRPSKGLVLGMLDIQPR